MIKKNKKYCVDCDFWVYEEELKIFGCCGQCGSKNIKEIKEKVKE